MPRLSSRHRPRHLAKVILSSPSLLCLEPGCPPLLACSPDSSPGPSVEAAGGSEPHPPGPEPVRGVGAVPQRTLLLGHLPKTFPTTALRHCASDGAVTEGTGPPPLTLPGGTRLSLSGLSCPRHTTEMPPPNSLGSVGV